ncbi:MAG: 16S rRNA (uracil(1498)-N(3))-methyltransferase [Treponemataceae bacterium]|nr:16S rRNA (uracil(1498)-N(3))-methyltransferase [Treponemataceae bacterium]
MNLLLFSPDELGRPLARRDPRAIHLCRVLHKKVGDTFDAGVLGGFCGIGRIVAVESNGDLIIDLNLDKVPPAKHPLRIGVAFVRPIQLRRLLRELTCLGLSHIDILGSDLGEKSYRDTRLLEDGGSRDAMIEGLIQSRDTVLPQLEVFVSLDQWLTMVDKSGTPGILRLAPDTVNPVLPIGAIPPFKKGETEQKAQAYTENRSGHTRGKDDVPFAERGQGPSIRPCLAYVVIGPERGWSSRERQLLDQAGFLRCSMGERALRTETAAIVAVSLVLEKMGVF